MTESQASSFEHKLDNTQNIPYLALLVGENEASTDEVLVDIKSTTSVQDLHKSYPPWLILSVFRERSPTEYLLF